MQSGGRFQASICFAIFIADSIHNRIGTAIAQGISSFVLHESASIPTYTLSPVQVQKLAHLDLGVAAIG